LRDSARQHWANGPPEGRDGRSLRLDLDLPPHSRPTGVAVDERPQRRPLVAVAAHRLAVDPQREAGIGVAHLVHDDAGILAERVQDRRECTAQRVR
jgi:hypothetical protein